MSPMSCVSGIHDRLASSARVATPVEIASMFVVTLRCVRTTPFGSLVEPDENWMNAVSSGVARCSVPGTDTSEISSRNTVRRASAASASARPFSSA